MSGTGLGASFGSSQYLARVCCHQVCASVARALWYCRPPSCDTMPWTDLCRRVLLVCVLCDVWH
eukprot:2947358-Rhodomonas_salina.2